LNQNEGAGGTQIEFFRFPNPDLQEEQP